MDYDQFEDEIEDPMTGLVDTEEVPYGSLRFYLGV